MSFSVNHSLIRWFVLPQFRESVYLTPTRHFAAILVPVYPLARKFHWHSLERLLLVATRRRRLLVTSQCPASPLFRRCSKGHDHLIQARGEAVEMG